MDRRDAHRVEERAAVAAGDERERDGGVRRAERRRAELAGVDAEQLGGDADRVHVRGLALVGAGADRREALHVLDGASPAPTARRTSATVDVALEVDERVVLVAVRERERRRVGKARRRSTRPTHSTAGSSPSGTGAPIRSSQRSRPRAWLQRCTRGLQPPLTGGDAVGVAVRRGRAREHQPGQVVVREDRRPLERAGREHDPLRADPPQPPAALDREHVVAVVDRDHRRAREHANAVERLARELLGEDHAPARGAPRRRAPSARRRRRAPRSARASRRSAPRARATSRPFPASGSATSPSWSSTSVARSIGSAPIWTSAFGSSSPAV